MKTELSRPKDFMSYMLNFAGPKASEKEMASHINALMMAGVITTSTFLSGVLYYLMTSPESLNKLVTELRTTFSSLEEITCASTAQCEYLAAVIQEGLRIYPPAGGAHLPRIVPPEGAIIAGYRIPGRVCSFFNPVIIRESGVMCKLTSFNGIDSRLGSSMVRCA